MRRPTAVKVIALVAVLSLYFLNGCVVKSNSKSQGQSSNGVSMSEGQIRLRGDLASKYSKLEKLGVRDGAVPIDQRVIQLVEQYRPIDSDEDSYQDRSVLAEKIWWQRVLSDAAGDASPLFSLDWENDANYDSLFRSLDRLLLGRLKFELIGPKLDLLGSKQVEVRYRTAFGELGWTHDGSDWMSADPVAQLDQALARAGEARRLWSIEVNSEDPDSMNLAMDGGQSSLIFAGTEAEVDHLSELTGLPFSTFSEGQH
jgi:hypothetical protein